jgi:glucan phosphoethanolaminetransferase (alkaline phosphatase superfamily)
VYSLFNGVITAFGIFTVIKYDKLEKGDAFSYGEGFTLGIVTGFVATILFSVFFLIYATEIDPDFLIQLLTVFKQDYNVHIGLVTFVVAIMGFATTVVITLTCMQYFKKSWNIPQKA